MCSGASKSEDACYIRVGSGPLVGYASPRPGLTRTSGQNPVQSNAGRASLVPFQTGPGQTGADRGGPGYRVF